MRNSVGENNTPIRNIGQSLEIIILVFFSLIQMSPLALTLQYLNAKWRPIVLFWTHNYE